MTHKHSTSLFDRFWDWAPDHPWKFTGSFYAVYFGVPALLVMFGWVAPAIGFLIGGSFGAIRVAWSSYGIWRDNKRWNEYLAGRGTYR